jgi:hypothetical protein
MSQSERIIDKFGGINPMARALGHQNASTVQGWRERGFIPAKQHQAVWDAARRAGIKIELHEFAAVAHTARRAAE